MIFISDSSTEITISMQRAVATLPFFLSQACFPASPSHVPALKRSSESGTVTLHGLIEVIALLHASHRNHGRQLPTSMARHRNHAIAHHHIARAQLHVTQLLINTPTTRCLWQWG